MHLVNIGYDLQHFINRKIFFVLNRMISRKNIFGTAIVIALLNL